MSTPITPVIGKTVIETLTSGMYEDPRFIYREYIQNSADQIDVAVEDGVLKDRNAGKIKISIDPINRVVTVEDNATGISAAKTRSFLGDIANSNKDLSKRKGFRGIGRLGGLGYCDSLVFETSYKGENVKTVMTLNAKLLKEIINNRQDNTDAAGVISVVTNTTTQPHPVTNHFFKVSLFNASDNILDKASVIEYLSMVAPVEFDPRFKYTQEIKDNFKSKNFIFEEYQVALNERKIYKAYKNDLLTNNINDSPEITSVGFFDVYNTKSEILALGWYGISSKLNNIIDKINPERGIRIRKNNITIGDENTLFDRFKSDRTNLRYIGEIHALGEGFIPNARRDYFNENKTIDEFEKALDKIFEKFESGLPHKASDLHNRLKEIVSFRQKLRAFKKDAPTFKTPKEQEQRKNEVLHSLTLAEKASTKLAKIQIDAEGNPQLNELFKSIVADYNYAIEDKETSVLHGKRVYPPLEFSKVNKSEAKILNEVVILLQDELGHKAAEPIIKKLQKKYN